MKKLTHSLLAALAFAGAIQTPTHADPVSEFYYWSDPPYITGSFGQWLNNNQTQFQLQAWWCSSDGFGKNGRLEVWQRLNVAGAPLVRISNTPFYNQITASISWSGGTATNAYARVNVILDNGVVNQYAEATH